MALCWVYRCCCSQRRVGQEAPPLPTGRSPLPGGVAAAAKLSKSLAPEGEIAVLVYGAYLYTYVFKKLLNSALGFLNFSRKEMHVITFVQGSFSRQIFPLSFLTVSEFCGTLHLCICAVGTNVYEEPATPLILVHNAESHSILPTDSQISNSQSLEPQTSKHLT